MLERVYKRLNANNVCKYGNLHIPVKAIHPDGMVEYHCQNCGKPVTKKYWDNSKARFVDVR